jgi:hypothetical protein
MTNGPVGVALLITSDTLPEALVRVTVCAGLVVPTASDGKVILDGAIVGGIGCGPLGDGVALAAAATALPHNWTVCGLAGLLWALSLNVRVPVCVPGLVGMNSTPIVQCCNGCTVALLHVSLPVLARKGPVNATVVKTNGKVPDVLVTVTVWAVLVVPTVCPEKVRLFGSMVGADGCGPLGEGVGLAGAATPVPNSCTV